MSREEFLTKRLAERSTELERLRNVLEDAVDTLESMDLHIDNPLYERLRAALDQNDMGIGCGKSVIEPWSDESSPPKETI